MLYLDDEILDRRSITLEDETMGLRSGYIGLLGMECGQEVLSCLTVSSLGSRKRA